MDEELGREEPAATSTSKASPSGPLGAAMATTMLSASLSLIESMCVWRTKLLGGLIIKRPARHAWSGSTAENGVTKFDVTRAGRRSLNKGKRATNAHAIWRQVRRPTSGETLARSASTRSSPAIGPVTALLRSRPFHAATPNSPAYVIKCSPIAAACSYA